MTGAPFKPKGSLRIFKFGEGNHHTVGQLSVRFPGPSGNVIRAKLDVIQADVPMLFGLDILDKEGFVADNTTNRLQ